MFTRIVIGVDGHTGGRDALALAARLTGGARVRLTAVHVAHEARDGSPIDARPYEMMLSHELDHTGVLADTLVVGHAFAATGLHRAVARLGADLLVLGSSRDAGHGNVLRGHTARAALHDATCAVAVAARGLHVTPWRRTAIGVGFDGSSASRHALAVGAELARAADAPLRLIAVGEPADRLLRVAPDGRPWLSMEAQRAASSRAMVARAVERLAATGLEVSGDVVPGLAGEGLRAFSDDVDLLVLGSCRYGPVRRILLGSTAELVLDTAHCPVIVVPREASRTERPPAAAATAAAVS
jgi:nucleotide-binding universal stress UspA family protein